jgi:hypothetical protein
MASRPGSVYIDTRIAAFTTLPVSGPTLKPAMQKLPAVELPLPNITFILKQFPHFLATYKYTQHSYYR